MTRNTVDQEQRIEVIRHYASVLEPLVAALSDELKKPDSLIANHYGLKVAVQRIEKRLEELQSSITDFDGTATAGLDIIKACHYADGQLQALPDTTDRRLTAMLFWLMARFAWGGTGLGADFSAFNDA